MKFYVGVTNNDWFYQLREVNSKEPVNFWRPTTRRFETLKPGNLFLFKLHSPKDYVVGGGAYVRFKVLTAASAWQEFGIRNGTPSQTELQNRLAMMRSRMQMAEDPQFGSIVLANPFFFQDADWIPIYDFYKWKPSTVQGETLDSGASGKELWDQLQRVLSKPQ